MKKYISLFIIIASCVNPYDYTVDAPAAYLVVDGFISNQPGDSGIKISFSKAFNSREPEEFPEADVIVIEDEEIYHSFIEKTPGYYIPEDPSFIALEDRTYTLQIVTGNKTYESNEVQIKKAARIDNLSFATRSIYRSIDKLEIRAMDLLVSTEEELDASMYYRYAADETWMIFSPESSDSEYNPIFIYDDNDVIIGVEWDIEYHTNISNCWRNSFTQGINVATTEGLVRNQLISFPAFTFSIENNKLLVGYNAIIKQYSIPKEVYNFLYLLNKFSANDISLFDVQPGFVQGNITCVSDSREEVIGIFYASDVQEKSIYISINDLTIQDMNVVVSYELDCETEYFIIPSDSGAARLNALKEFKDMNLSGMGLMVSFVGQDENNSEIVNITSRFCADCRTGGTNIQPDNWP